MHRHEFGAVGKRRLDLHAFDHLGHTLHDLITEQNARTPFHQIGHAMTITRAFDDEVGNQRNRFWVVEFNASLEPASRNLRGHGDQELVFLSRCQMHDAIGSDRPVNDNSVITRFQ